MTCAFKVTQNRGGTIFTSSQMNERETGKIHSDSTEQQEESGLRTKTCFPQTSTSRVVHSTIILYMHYKKHKYQPLVPR